MEKRGALAPRFDSECQGGVNATLTAKQNYNVARVGKKLSIWRPGGREVLIGVVSPRLKKPRHRPGPFCAHPRMLRMSLVDH